jgi:hypothetical protein
MYFVVTLLLNADVIFDHRRLSLRSGHGLFNEPVHVVRCVLLSLSSDQPDNNKLRRLFPSLYDTAATATGIKNNTQGFPINHSTTATSTPCLLNSRAVAKERILLGVIDLKKYEE